MNGIIKSINRVSLIQQIIIGLIIGILAALFVPEFAKELSLLGVLFVGALKGIAPLLVFFLVMAAISKHRSGQKTGMTNVIVLYLLGTFTAAVLAVVVSWMFPTTLNLVTSAADAKPPEGIAQVLTTVLKNVVDNPVHAIMTGNYIGILGWALMLGSALRHAPTTTKEVIEHISAAVATVVGWVIRFAPLGIMGLVADSIATSGLDALLGYAKLLVVLLGCMIFVAFVVNPLLVFIYLRRNPYPLVFKCLRESAVYAFFTRSSAANIPVNLDLGCILKYFEVSSTTIIRSFENLSGSFSSFRYIDGCEKEILKPAFPSDFIISSSSTDLLVSKLSSCSISSFIFVEEFL